MATKIKPAWKKNPMPKAGQYVNSVGISGDGQIVIGGTYFYDYSKNANHTTTQPAFTVGVFVWNAKGKLQWKDKFSATEGVYWVAVSRDGAHAAAVGLQAHANGFIYAYDAANGAKQLSDTTSSRVNMAALSGDGTYLVAGSNSLRLYQRNGPNWSAAQILPNVPGDHIVAVGISDDGQWVCAGTYQGRVILVQNNNGVLGVPIIWQQPGGEIYWLSMAADGSTFAVGAKHATVFCFDVAGFPGTQQPAWSQKLTGCTRCGAVGISGDGKLVSAVGNNGKAGKVFLFSNLGNAAQTLWNKATTRNPNSTTLDNAGQFVTAADGFPDGSQGDFYLYDIAGNLQWSYKTTNMSWPMQISANATGLAAGSDDGHVYYFA